MKNAKFLKKKLDMSCWYCDKPSNGTLNFLNGDEIPVCLVCANKHIHFVRKPQKAHKSPSEQKQAISGANSLVENGQNGVLGERA